MCDGHGFRTAAMHPDDDEEEDDGFEVDPSIFLGADGCECEDVDLGISDDNWACGTLDPNT